MTIRYGITGNYYVTSKHILELVEVCENISKSKKSIYFNKKYRLWAIRIKSRKHKKILKKFTYNFVGKEFFTIFAV